MYHSFWQLRPFCYICECFFAQGFPFKERAEKQIRHLLVPE